MGFAVGAVDRPGPPEGARDDVSRLGGVAVWGAVAAVVALAARSGVLDGADFARVRVMWVPLALGAALLAFVGCRRRRARAPCADEARRAVPRRRRSS
jgi:hypothetical protein